MPKLTVALLTYNRARFLAAAIESILGQRFSDFELIIADNASTDDTPEIVGRYRDPRIRYIRHPTNAGASNSAARALEEAHGQYFMVAHDDDVQKPELLAREVAVLDSHTDAILVGTNIEQIDEAGNVTLSRRLPYQHDVVFKQGQYIEANLTDVVWLPTPTVMYRTAQLRDPRIRSEYLHAMQLGLCADIAVFCSMNIFGALHVISDPLLSYRQHSRQESKNTWSTAGTLELYRYLYDLCWAHPQFEHFCTPLAGRILNYEIESILCDDLGEPFEKTQLTERVRQRINAFTPGLCGGEGADAIVRVDILAVLLGLEPFARLDTLETLDAQATLDSASSHSEFVLRLFQRWLLGLIRNKMRLTSTLFQAGVRRACIFGSALTACLLLFDLAAEGIDVLVFLDNSQHRQGGRLAGIPIARPDWVREHADEVDAVVLSSAGAHDLEIRHQLDVLVAGKFIEVISWKELASELRATP